MDKDSDSQMIDCNGEEFLEETLEVQISDAEGSSTDGDATDAEVTTPSVRGQISEPLRLISSVKKHPCIWQVDHPEYNIRQAKDAAWATVYEDTVYNWHELGKADKHAKREEIKKRWFNIRDSYRKDLLARRNLDEEAARKRHRYVYSKWLSFLRPIFKTTKRGRIVKEEKTTVIKKAKRSWSHNSSSTSPSKDLDDSNTSFKFHTPRKHNVSKSHKNRNHTSVTPSHTSMSNTSQTRNNLTALERSLLETIRQRDDDSDLCFFKGLLPNIRTLTESQNLRFKLSVVQLLDSIKDDSSVPESSFIVCEPNDDDENADDDVDENDHDDKVIVRNRINKMNS